jgi:hypothetical protein
MVGLRQDTKGNFGARKRLPDDVREEYGLRHGSQSASITNGRLI